MLKASLQILQSVSTPSSHNIAYEVLSDEKKRRDYDRFGEEGMEKAAQAHQQRNFDPFSMFFGHNMEQGEKQGPPQFMRVRVSLEDLYLGKEHEVMFVRNTFCPHCRGSGAENFEDVEECPVCHGSGVVHKRI